MASVLKDSFGRWMHDDVRRRGAALAYNTVFSAAPLMLITLTVVGKVLGPDAAEGLISDRLGAFIGSDRARVIEDLISSARASGKATTAGIVGCVLLLMGAVAVVGELQSALMSMWGTRPETGGLIAWLKDRLLSVAFVLSVGFLMLVSLLVNASAAAAGKWFSIFLPVPEAALQAVNGALTASLIWVVFALIFKVLPRARVAWGDVWIGAGVTALLFTLGNFALGIYLGKAAPTSMYGAAGSLLGFLLWAYYCAQILYFGAEFTRVYSERRGSGWAS